MQLVSVDGEQLGEAQTVFCIGRNYAAHAAELGNEVPSEPVIFLKATAALRGLDPVAMGGSGLLHHEVELVLRVGSAVALGARGSWGQVSHCTLGLDLTRRQVQSVCKKKGHPWTRAKSFAGSGVLGPFVPATQLDPEQLSLSLEVEGELRQSASTTLMLFDVPTILTHLAALHPLREGDVVYTGTPAGVGEIRGGDGFRMVLASAGREWSFAGVI